MNKKQVREKFNTAVFIRDGRRCRMCGSSGTLNAHHITDRHEMPNGGYVKENGITLCEETCHLKAEKYHMSGGKEWIDGMHPDDLYKLIDSSYERAFEASEHL